MTCIGVGPLLGNLRIFMCTLRWLFLLSSLPLYSLRFFLRKLLSWEDTLELHLSSKFQTQGSSGSQTGADEAQLQHQGWSGSQIRHQMDGASSPRREPSCCTNCTHPARYLCRRLGLVNILAQKIPQELEDFCTVKGSGLSNLHRVVEGLESEQEVAGLPSEGEGHKQPPPLQ